MEDILESERSDLCVMRFGEHDFSGFCGFNYCILWFDACRDMIYGGGHSRK